MKKFFKSFTLFCLCALVTIGSIFVVNINNNNQFASAANTSFIGGDNTTYTGLQFISSDYFFIFTKNVDNMPDSFSVLNNLSRGTTHYDSLCLQYHFKISFNDNFNKVNVAVGAYHDSLTFISKNDEAGFFDFEFNFSNTGIDEFLQLNYFICGSKYYTGVQFIIENTTNTSDNPSLVMKSVILSNYNDFANRYNTFYQDCSGSPYFNSNVISYLDTAGYRYSFIVCNCFSYDTLNYTYMSKYYSYREYFLSSSNEWSDNDYYIQGKSDGYASGLIDGEKNGYTNGFSAGKTEGVNIGYNNGVESANAYSFLSLIGAVVDAPVSVFSSLFNFELLGVNLLSFFTSLLTFAVCLLLLRLILGGK